MQVLSTVKADEVLIVIGAGPEIATSSPGAVRFHRISAILESSKSESIYLSSSFILEMQIY